MDNNIQWMVPSTPSEILGPFYVGERGQSTGPKTEEKHRGLGKYNSVCEKYNVPDATKTSELK